MSSEKENINVQEKRSGVFPFVLDDVRLYEVHIERCKPDEEQDQVESLLRILLHSGDEPLDADEFSLLLTLETNFLFQNTGTPECNLFLAIEGRFVSVVDMGTIKPEVIQRFKEADALILMWPYLRQTLHDLTVRMRLDVPPLPIVDPQTLITAIVEEEEEDESEE